MELYKNIEWADWLYKISNQWNVISMNYKRTWKQHNMILINHNWYLTVKLRINWIQKTKKIHRLVLETFSKNNFNKPYVNHIDWNKQNNKLENLEWVTAKENVRHSDKIWLRKISWSDNFHAKEIFQYSNKWLFIKEWWSISEAATNLSVCKTMISLVLSWKRKTTWWFIFKYKYEYIKFERVLWEKLILS